VATPATRRAPRCRADAGDTLVEVMATMVVMSIAVAAILAGIGTSLRLSGTHRNFASAGVVMGAAAEAVKVATPVACSSVTTSSYSSALTTIPTKFPGFAFPTGWSASNLSITAATCNNSSTTKLQTITVQAKRGSSACTTATTQCESVSVVKRSP
jgi:uncharacterized membrane protein